MYPSKRRDRGGGVLEFLKCLFLWRDQVEDKGAKDMLKEKNYFTPRSSEEKRETQ